MKIRSNLVSDKSTGQLIGFTDLADLKNCTVVVAQNGFF